MPQSQRIRLHWPVAGRNDRYGYQDQVPASTVYARNVWPDAQRRERGGSRPGFKLAYFQNVGINQPVWGIGTVQYVPGGADRVHSQLVAIGDSSEIFYGEYGAGEPSAAVSLVTINGRIFTMCELNQKLYMTNGAGGVFIWNPATVTASSLTASVGTLPIGCDIICAWRYRIVLSGGATNPYGVFFSRQGDPTDWDYSVQDASGAQSLALANAGQIGDVVTAMCPHADNCLILGCPTSLWMLQGDPRSGGQLLNLSQTIGIVDRNAWCTTPDGLFVFLSADGLYMIPAGCSSTGNPVSLSREKLPVELLNVSRSTGSDGKVASLAYDVRHRGIHVFIARRPDGVTDTGNTHWFFDWETKSFWEVQFAQAGMDPWCATAMKNTPSSESVVACGCRDGQVRVFDTGTTTDALSNISTPATKTINSYVALGPFGDDPALSHDVRLDQMDLSLSSGSGDVTWSLYRGNSAEEATSNLTAGLESNSGTIGPGRNYRSYPRVRGSAIYLKLSSTASWAYEAGTALLSKLGRVRV